MSPPKKPPLLTPRLATLTAETDRPENQKWIQNDIHYPSDNHDGAGVLVSPVARIAPLPTMGITSNPTPKHQGII